VQSSQGHDVMFKVKLGSPVVVKVMMLLSGSY